MTSVHIYFKLPTSFFKREATTRIKVLTPMSTQNYKAPGAFAQQNPCSYGVSWCQCSNPAKCLYTQPKRNPNPCRYGAACRNHNPPACSNRAACRYTHPRAQQHMKNKGVRRAVCLCDPKIHQSCPMHPFGRK
jgi:hypothetical protein